MFTKSTNLIKLLVAESANGKTYHRRKGLLRSKSQEALSSGILAKCWGPFFREWRIALSRVL